MTTIQGPQGPRSSTTTPAGDEIQGSQQKTTTPSTIPDLPPPQLSEGPSQGIQPSLPPPSEPLELNQLQGLMQRLQGTGAPLNLANLQSALGNPEIAPDLSQIIGTLGHIQGLLGGTQTPSEVAWLGTITPLAGPDEGPLFPATLLTAGLEQLGLGSTLQHLSDSLVPVFQDAGMETDDAQSWASLHASVTLVGGLYALSLAASISGQAMDDPQLLNQLEQSGEAINSVGFLKGLSQELAHLEQAVASILDTSVGTPLHRGRLTI